MGFFTTTVYNREGNKETQMSTFKAFIFIFSGIFFLSCQSNNSCLSISSEVIEKAIKLFPEDTLFHTEYLYVDMYVLEDSLILGYKNTSKLRKGQGVFDVYNLNRNKIENSFLPFGNFGSPFLSGTIYHCEDLLLAHEFISKILYFIPLTKEVLRAGYSPQAIDFPDLSQRLHTFNGIILKQNPYHYIDKEGHSLNKNTVRLLYSGEDQANAEHLIDCFNVSQGHIGVKSDMSRIVYVDANQRRIEFYDKELNLIKVVLGPGIDNYELDIHNMYNKYKEAIYVGFVPESFVDIAYDDGYIYTAFTGRAKCNDEDRECFATFIIKLDWDGDFIESFQVNSYVKTMNLSNDGETLFVYGQDNKTDYSVVSYKLKNS